MTHNPDAYKHSHNQTLGWHCLLSTLDFSFSLHSGPYENYAALLVDSAVLLLPDHARYAATEAESGVKAGDTGAESS